MKENNYNLIYRIYSPKIINKYKQKLKMLGKSDFNEVNKFLYTRLLFSIIIFCITFLLSDFSYILTLVTTLLFYFGYSYYNFDYYIKKRALSLEKDAIFFFEILLLSLESGKNLVQALNTTVKNVNSSLSTEFNKALKEIEYGKSFHEAFSDLRKNIPSDIIQNVILNIIDSYTSGGNINETLKNQIEFIRDKRVMDIKTKINQIPVKISIVSVFLFIPLVLLLILSPVLLEYFLK